VKIPVLSCMVLAAVLMGGSVALGQNTKPPVISHDSVPAAVRGQPLSIIAKVSAGSAEVKAVNLYYTLSKDAAPFKVVMQNSGASVYYGSIPAHLLGSVKEISYYIEAIDKAENTSETDWFAVPVKDAKAADQRAYQPPVAPVAPAKPQQVTPSQPEKKGKMGTALTVGLIGAGAAAVVGGAIYLANSGGGGGGDNPDTDKAGTYAGSETICFSLMGGTPDCTRRDIRVVIDTAGVVRSDTLQPGTALEGRLNGSSFVLVATINEPASNRTGEIFFSGNIVEGRILGSIDGQTTEPAGQGQYTGTFTATKL
jgi:hypothetical protein